MATHDNETKPREQASSTAADAGRDYTTLSCPRCNEEFEQYMKTENVRTYRCPTEGCNPVSIWWRFKQRLTAIIPGTNRNNR